MGSGGEVGQNSSESSDWRLTATVRGIFDSVQPKRVNAKFLLTVLLSINHRRGQFGAHAKSFLNCESLYQVPKPEDETAGMQLPLIARYNFIRFILNGFWKVCRADSFNMLKH